MVSRGTGNNLHQPARSTTQPREHGHACTLTAHRGGPSPLGRVATGARGTGGAAGHTATRGREQDRTGQKRTLEDDSGGKRTYRTYRQAPSRISQVFAPKVPWLRFVCAGHGVCC